MQGGLTQVILRAQPPRARQGRREVQGRRGPRRHVVGGVEDVGALRQERARREGRTEGRPARAAGTWIG